MHKNVNKFLQAIIAFPVLAMSFTGAPFPGVTVGSPLAAAISPDQTRTLSSVLADNKQQDIVEEAAKIDAYFAQYDLPMEGKGYKLAKAASDNDLPPASLAAMAMIESTGGKFAYANNPFGYGNKVKFSSVDEAIDTVAKTLAAKNDATKDFYANKTFPQKIRVYNGPAVKADPRYVAKVMWVMDQIDGMQVPVETASASAITKV